VRGGRYSVVIAECRPLMCVARLTFLKRQ